MIISVDELRKQIDCGDMTDYRIQSRLERIETVIRKYTNNNFQNRKVRFVASSLGDQIMGSSPFLRVGDTIQISQSEVNDGLYVITEITEDCITVDRDLFEIPFNKVTKIEYEADIVDCAIKLFEWENEFGSKVGIKSESETLSRHSASITYEDSSNLYMGYPVGILNGLYHYKKVRC